MTDSAIEKCYTNFYQKSNIWFKDKKDIKIESESFKFKLVGPLFSNQILIGLVSSAKYTFAEIRCVYKVNLKIFEFVLQEIIF